MGGIHIKGFLKRETKAKTLKKTLSKSNKN